MVSKQAKIYQHNRLNDNLVCQERHEWNHNVIFLRLQTIYIFSQLLQLHRTGHSAVSLPTATFIFGGIRRGPSKRLYHLDQGEDTDSCRIFQWQCHCIVRARNSANKYHLWHNLFQCEWQYFSRAALSI